MKQEYKKLNSAELEKFLFYIQKDKKKVNSGVKFVLPVGQGRMEFITLENDFLKGLLS